MSYNWKCCSFYPNNFDASALSLFDTPKGLPLMWRQPFFTFLLHLSFFHII